MDNYVSHSRLMQLRSRWLFISLPFPTIVTLDTTHSRWCSYKVGEVQQSRLNFTWVGNKPHTWEYCFILIFTITQPSLNWLIQIIRDRNGKFNCSHFIIEDIRAQRFKTIPLKFQGQLGILSWTFYHGRWGARELGSWSV